MSVAGINQTANSPVYALRKTKRNVANNIIDNNGEIQEWE